jgi:hypothetical protein
MDELAARAVVVPASAVGEGLTTSIPRSEIQEVLDLNESPIELVLDVAQFKDGKATDTRSVAVSWERSELEKLLRASEDENVMLTFDKEALGQAFATDVEAHGIRETVLALAVAATAASGVASSASAEPGMYLGTGAPPVEQTSPEIPYLSHGQGVTEADLGIVTGTSPDDRAVARSETAAAPTSPDDRAVSRSEPAAASTPAGPEIPYLSHGQGVTEADLGITTGTSPDDRAVPRSEPAAAPAPTGPEIPYLSHGQGVTEADLGIGTGTSPDDRALPRTDPVATTGGTTSDPGTFSVPSPAETATIAGVIALMITGAFFIVGGRRRMRPGAA